jgi:competence protein ComEC
VLQIKSSGNSIMLTGDIQRQGEARLVTQYGATLASTILVAPHHGSKTSSGSAFVARVQPRYTVFSSGYRNRFGHPHPLVVKRYARSGADMAGTAQYGAISFRLHPHEGIQGPQLYRLESRHYWNR